MKKRDKSILSALLLVVIFAAWLIVQRTGLLGGGAATPLVELSDDQLELPASREGDRIMTYKGYVSSYNPETLIPDWVAYELTEEETHGDATREDKGFSMASRTSKANGGGTRRPVAGSTVHCSGVNL